MKKLIIFFACLTAFNMGIMQFPVSALENSAVSESSTLAKGSVTSGVCGGFQNEENVTWTFDNATGILTISGTGRMTYWGDTYNISPWSENSAIRKVIIENGVQTLGDYAFSGCENLTSVSIPDSMIEDSIPVSAFDNCPKLASISVSKNNACYSSENGVLFDKDKRKLLYYPAGNTQKEYTIPDNVESLTSSWQNCSALTKVFIPESVSYIDGDTFKECLNLTAIEVAENNPNYFSENGVLFQKIYQNNSDWIESAESTSSEYSVQLMRYPVGNSRTEYTIPENVSYITSGAFAGCVHLKNIYVSENNTRYLSENGVLFSKDHEDYINLEQYPAGKTETEYIVPDNVINIIPEYAFAYCSALTSVTFPENVTSLSKYTFAHCSHLTSVNFPEDMVVIDEGVFFDCPALTSVTIPDSVYHIGERAFASSGLTSVTIPDSVQYIGNYAFFSCSNLTSVEIPKIMISIGKCAFAHCSSLASVRLPENTAVNIGKYAFADTPFLKENPFLIIKDVLIDCAIPDNGNVTIPEGVTAIRGNAFSNCPDLISVTIPDSMTEIGNGAFSDCSNLVSVTIPDSVTKIGEGAFDRCFALTSIKLPKNLTTIASTAFADCINLTSISIPENVKEIQDYAFANCPRLASVSIPETVTNIGLSAFSGTQWLKENPLLIVNHVLYDGTECTGEVVIPDGVTKIKHFAFRNEENLNALTAVSLPESVTEIGSDAFQSCQGLTSVTIPENVEIIGSDAFSDCSNLTSVTIQNVYCRISDSETTIPEKATIYGYRNSFAEGYANKYNRKFVALEGNENQPLLEITPVIAPFNDWFFVKTNVPDPTGLRFVDKDSVYDKKATITFSKEVFPDVNYEDKNTLRVNGGYLFYSGNVDGGELSLEVKSENGKWIDSGLTFTLPELCDEADYLIQQYATKEEYFDNLEAVQEGLSSICLYSESYIRGNFIQVNDYWHVSTSPFIDQHFYLYSPYDYQQNQALFAAKVYPFINDSFSFPQLLAEVSDRLDTDSKATWEWSDEKHYLIDVTYRTGKDTDETRSFGGAGATHGQALTEKDIQPVFDFKEMPTLEQTKTILEDYAGMDIPDDIPTENKLTWKSICDTVGNGAWVRISHNSVISNQKFQLTPTYTYLYKKDNQDSYTVTNWGVGYETYWSGSLGFVSDTWVDGRYIDQYEQFVSGETFDQHPKSNILLLGMKIPVLNGTEITETTGNLLYCYNEKENLWTADLPDYQKILDLDESYSDLLQLTLEEVKTLHVDRNTNQLPESGYIYDGTAEPATIFENEKIYQKGDPDGNGEIDIRDVILVNRAILGKSTLSKEQIEAVDFNGNGYPEPAEALMIMKYIVKIITDFS